MRKAIEITCISAILACAGCAQLVDAVVNKDSANSRKVAKAKRGSCKAEPETLPTAVQSAHRFYRDLKDAQNANIAEKTKFNEKLTKKITFGGHLKHKMKMHSQLLQLQIWAGKGKENLMLKFHGNASPKLAAIKKCDLVVAECDYSGPIGTSTILFDDCKLR